MFGKKYEYSHGYSVEVRNISYESLSSVFKEISRVHQEVPPGQIKYLLPGDLTVTVLQNGLDTFLWFTGSSRKLPRDIRSLLGKIGAEQTFCGGSSLEEKIDLVLGAKKAVKYNNINFYFPKDSLKIFS